MSEKLYSKQEVDRILRRAMEATSSKGDALSEAEIIRIAEELGIDQNQVRIAMREDASVTQFENAKIMWKRKKKREFYQHLSSYVIVNGFLVGLNVVMSGGISWAIFPILGWGIGLTFDFIESIFPSEEKVEKGARKLMASNKWKKLFDNIVDKKVIDTFLDSLMKK